MYDHFLITRFNIPHKNWIKDKSGVLIKNHAWLCDRFCLFERYCFPSIISQTNQNFKWLVFFDINTPSPFKEKIDHYKGFYPNFIPCYVADVDEFLGELALQINHHLSGSSDALITSRVDNDDALHKQYIENIQKRAVGERDVILNFQLGYKLDAIRQILYSCIHNSSPFVSRVEPIDGSKFKTVMSFDHTEASANAPVLQLEQVGWMVVVHEHNLENQVSGRPLFSPAKVLDEFGVEYSNEKFRMDYVGMLMHCLRVIKIKFCKAMKIP